MQRAVTKPPYLIASSERPNPSFKIQRTLIYKYNDADDDGLRLRKPNIFAICAVVIKLQLKIVMDDKVNLSTYSLHSNVIRCKIMLPIRRCVVNCCCWSGKNAVPQRQKQAKSMYAKTLTLHRKQMQEFGLHTRINLFTKTENQILHFSKKKKNTRTHVAYRNVVLCPSMDLM